MGEEKVGLTHAELEQACRNVGVDLMCGACAGQFYTGSAMGEHTCAGYEEKCLEYSALRAVRAYGEALRAFNFDALSQRADAAVTAVTAGFARAREVLDHCALRLVEYAREIHK